MMKVTLGFIPDNCTEPNVVQIDKMSITYTQNADANSNKDEYQYLTIESQNAGVSEDDLYYNIKVDTHWSVYEPEQLADLVRDFKKRMELEITKVEDLKTYKRKEE